MTLPPLDLADILKSWEFQRKRDRDGTLWIAPPLSQLRDAISRKYPAVEWENTATEWSGGAALGAAIGQTAEDVGAAINPGLDAKIKSLTDDQLEFPF